MDAIILKKLKLGYNHTIHNMQLIFGQVFFGFNVFHRTRDSFVRIY